MLLSHEIVTDERVAMHVIHAAENVDVHVGIALAQLVDERLHLPPLGERVVVLDAGGKLAGAVEKFQLMPLRPGDDILFVDVIERTNELHPFREGNGRTQRVFLAQLAHHAGYNLDFTRIDPDDLMIATIQAAHGVDDFLRELFHEMLIFDDGNDGLLTTI